MIHNNNNNNNSNNNNNNNINNNDNNKINCILHYGYIYRFVCSTCKVALCDLCIIDKDHRGHETNLINKESIEPIIQEFKYVHFKSLTTYSERIKYSLDISNKKFNQIEEQHNQNVNSIIEEFKQLYKILQTIENDSIRQLVTHYDDNKDINTNISTIANIYLKNIDQIQNIYKDIKNDLKVEPFNNENNINKNLEILKHCHQTKLILKETSNKCEINKLLNDFNNITMENSIDTFKDSIKDIIKIKLDSKNVITNYKSPISVSLSGVNFFIYKDGCTIPDDTKYLALGPGIKNFTAIQFPKTIISIALLDGFDVSLTVGMLPNSLQHLYMGAVKWPLLEGSIPQYVSQIFLMPGFNQKIAEFPRYLYAIYIDTPSAIFSRPNAPLFITPSCKNNYQKVSCQIYDWIDASSHTIIQDPFNYTTKGEFYFEDNQQ
ncbi:hypothetical protein ACTA71_003258 [Dictyostelium dimigraforme]